MNWSNLVCYHTHGASMNGTAIYGGHFVLINNLTYQGGKTRVGLSIGFSLQWRYKMTIKQLILKWGKKKTGSTSYNNQMIKCLEF